MSPADQFDAIVSAHYESLFKFAMSLTRSESDAWDLTQQTFYVWATKGYQLRDISKIKTWLFTTLHRAFLKGQRRQVRFPSHDLEEVSEQLPVVSPAFADKVDSAQVLSALAKVDEVYQAAVALFYLSDFSQKEIAVILEVPVGTVKSRIARGIAQLRKLLLSDDSHALSPGEGQISSVAPDSDPEAVPEQLVPPRGQARPEKKTPGYSEWDLSSTLSWEPLGNL